MVSPDEVISQADQKRDEALSNLRDVADWFHQQEGELIERSEALDRIRDEFDLDAFTTQSILANLVGDRVDPIIQVTTVNAKYVGIVDYTEGDGWYGYVEYDDVEGKKNTVICAQCVHQAEYDTEVRFAREGDASFADGGSYSYQELAERVKKHYKDDHTVVPEEVETGASLTSGTTIGGNTAWHAGNDGGSSGLNADLVDGQHASDLSASGTQNQSAYAGEYSSYWGNSNNTSLGADSTPTTTVSRQRIIPSFAGSTYWELNSGGYYSSSDSVTLTEIRLYDKDNNLFKTISKNTSLGEYSSISGTISHGDFRWKYTEFDTDTSGNSGSADVTFKSYPDVALIGNHSHSI